MATTELRNFPTPNKQTFDVTLVDGKESFAIKMKKLQKISFESQNIGDTKFIQHAFEDNGGSFTDESDDARDDGDNDVNLLPAAPAVNDAFYFGAQDKFIRVLMEDGTDGAGVWTLVWEYWDGDSWATLTVYSSGSSTDFTNVSDEIFWTSPSDWERYQPDTSMPNGFYVRARVSAYTSITTRPLAKTISIQMKDAKQWSRAEQLLETMVLYGDAAAGTNLPRMKDEVLFEYFLDGNLAAADTIAVLQAAFDGEITRVEYSVASAGTTGQSSIDVNVAGTTIFTTQANRPILLTGASVLTDISRTIEAGTFSAQQRLSIDVVEVCTTPETDGKVTVYGRYKPYQEDEGEVTKVVLRAATSGTDSLTSIQYCRVDDGGSFVDEDSAAKDATDNDVELLVATVAVDDAVYYGCDVRFNKIVHVDGTDGAHTSSVIIWEYYDGDSWETLTISALTSDYTDISDPIFFELPSDWTSTTVNTQAAFWVRSRVTTAGTWTTLPQAASIDLGIAAVVDVNIGGTTIYTTQANRPILHDHILNGADEINGGRVDANSIPDSTGITNGRFTRNQSITADIDYAAPSTGVEPVDLEVLVYGALKEHGEAEKISWKNIGGKISIWSNNLKSKSKLRVIVEGY